MTDELTPEEALTEAYRAGQAAGPEPLSLQEQYDQEFAELAASDSKSIPKMLALKEKYREQGLSESDLQKSGGSIRTRGWLYSHESPYARG